MIKIEPMRILCSSTICKYCDGDRYYNLCKHPKKQNIAPYGGIVRQYVEGCNLREKKQFLKHDKNFLDEILGSEFINLGGK